MKFDDNIDKSDNSICSLNSEGKLFDSNEDYNYIRYVCIYNDTIMSILWIESYVPWETPIIMKNSCSYTKRPLFRIHVGKRNLVIIKS